MISIEFTRLHRALAIALLYLALLSSFGETWAFGRVALSPYLHHLLESINLTKETNATTWFQACLLVWCGYLASILARTEERQSRNGWWVVSWALFFMGMDEVASVHERTIPLFREMFHGGGLTYFTWVIPGAMLAGLLVSGLVFFSHLHLERPFGPITQGALLFFTGAIGLEMLSALLVDNQGHSQLPYFYVATVEEVFESAGALRMAQGLGQLLSEKPRSISPRPVILCGSFAALAAVLTVVGTVLELANYFDSESSRFMIELAQFSNITQERNLPTYLSSMGLLALAWAAWLLSRLESGGTRSPWAWLSAVFAFLSWDEIATFHERLEGLIRHSLGPLPGPLTRSWILVAPLLVILAYRAGKRVSDQFSEENRWRFLFGGFLFVLGTVGLKPLSGWLAAGQNYPVAFFFLAIFEDSLKFAGCALLLHSVFTRLNDQSNPVELKFVE